MCADLCPPVDTEVSSLGRCHDQGWHVHRVFLTVHSSLNILRGVARREKYLPPCADSVHVWSDADDCATLVFGRGLVVVLWLEGGLTQEDRLHAAAAPLEE